ncbi:tRNA pseudouridine synthase [Artomyces pyxidatus]|uniref:tRNA pseudouridine synthase n=1 Tax=Artomyces pyxidatus TaxID=48021 RepID=A0ACB8SW19_9AGAM|nr:tRNA pseudouridine synthase [Artomyces pyxidatus]
MTPSSGRISPRDSHAIHSHSHPSSYDSWTREQLIARLTQLSSSPLLSHSARRRSRSPPRPPAPPKKPFDFARHSIRKIALKFSYVGAEYNGLAFQNGPTPLPTVEGTLFDALAKTRLVDGAAGLDGCGWERCGRTDRGVSAAGQVVSLWVRSALGDVVEDVQKDVTPNTKKELRYLNLLNRVLPPSIRVHAYSPVAPSFSARFNCRARHYKYFFSPAHLDIAAMRSGAARLVGEHDFRNLCKLDPTKQITNFNRRVLRAEISPDDGGLWVFDLVGTAFLYHQVRHIMAVLLLIGSGLEPPSVVSALLNVDPSHPYPPFAEGEESPAVVECKPEYQMADGLPLVLWDAAYDERDLAQRAPIQTTLHSHFLTAAARYRAIPPNPFPLSHPLSSAAPGVQVDLGGLRSLNVPLGGGAFHRSSKYVRLLERNRMDPVDVVNERWRIGKGVRKADRKLRAVEEDDGDE